jgi:predicted ribosomally synthesized peptide with SipW-like signal peptide
MSDKKVELTRRKVLGGLATIGAAGAATGAGTMAYFDDTETSSGNTVQAGTLDLTTAEGSSLDLNDIELAPGQSVSASVDLQNDGTVSANHVEVDTSYSEGDSDGNVDAQSFAEQLEVSTLEYSGSDITTYTDTDGNGTLTLHELSDQTLDDLQPAPETNSGNSETFNIELTLPGEDTGNAFQGEGVDISFTFTLNQDSSQ